QTREVLRLVELRKNVWVARSAETPIKHRDDVVLSSLVIFRRMISPNETSWEPELNIWLFGDVPKKGKGIVRIKFTPTEYPASAAQMVSRVTADGHNEVFGGANPVPSAGIPKNFPVSTYPGCDIDYIADREIKLVSRDKTNQVMKYYEDELRRKGWKLQ